MSENGVYTAVKTNKGVTAVHISEELLELSRLNRRTGKRRSEHERLAVEAERAQQQRNLEMTKEEKRWERATIRLFKQELKVLAASVVVGIALKLGLVAAVFGIPVLIGCQTVICFRAGRYFGRYPGGKSR